MSVLLVIDDVVEMFAGVAAGLFEVVDVVPRLCYQ